MPITLTQTEIKQFRRDIGDTSQPPDLCDQDIQDVYDQAGDNGCAKVYALAQRLAKAVPKTPKFEQIQTLLVLRQSLDGCAGGPIRSGTISLGLDSEWPEYYD